MENAGYTDKELIEIITDLKVDIAGMKAEMANTRNAIKKYNGLRETQDDYGKRLQAIEDCISNKKENKKDYQWLFGIIVGVALACISKFL